MTVTGMTILRQRCGSHLQLTGEAQASWMGWLNSYGELKSWILSVGERGKLLAVYHLEIKFA